MTDGSWIAQHDELVAHLKHDESVAGCDWCDVRPILRELHDIWQHGTPEACALIWSMQDGYGEPGYTPEQGYDWSGVRDSTPATLRAIHKAVHA